MDARIDDATIPSAEKRTRTNVPDCQVDELDTRIIQALLDDARATNRSIGKYCGVTEVTVANRLRNLTDNNYLKIFPVFDWRAIGFSLECHIYIKVAKRSPISVAEILYRIPGVLTVAVTFGPANIVILVLATSEQSLYDIISTVEDVEGVSGIRVEPVQKIFLHRSSAIRLPANFTSPESFPTSVIDLDELDRGIIALLQENGRFSSREIARRLGVNDVKIRGRIRRMEVSGLMSLRAMVDPKQPGLVVLPSYLLVIVALRNPDLIAERLSRSPSFTFVAVTGARLEVVAVTTHSELPEINAAIERDVWTGNDVRSVQTYVIASFYKAIPDLIRIL